MNFIKVLSHNISDITAMLFFGANVESHFFVKIYQKLQTSIEYLGSTG